MKIRNGFVSNSSSSSFIINKEHLSSEQIRLIKNHIKHDRKNRLGFGVYGYYSQLNFAWEIKENDSLLGAYVFMDNFDMRGYLEHIGVPMEMVEWSIEYGEDITRKIK